jgi:hypothetical protein
LDTLTYNTFGSKKEFKMQMIREFKEINSDEIVIKIPRSFKEKRVEVIVLPAELPDRKTSLSKGFQLTTYKCYGKKKDFTRADAYEERI